MKPYTTIELNNGVEMPSLGLGVLQTFDLSADQMTAIDALDTGLRGGPAPDIISLENFSRPISEA